MDALIERPVCSWSEPGRNPFQGSASMAVFQVPGIPRADADVLHRRVAERDFDEVVVITRDAITGHGTAYGPDIVWMRYGKRTVCREVDRSMWPLTHRELAWVYCHRDNCLIIPMRCNNVSLIRQHGGARIDAGAAPAPEPVGRAAEPAERATTPSTTTTAPQPAGGTPTVPETQIAAMPGNAARLTWWPWWNASTWDSPNPWAVPVLIPAPQYRFETPGPSVTAVSEPPTWVLLILALAAVSGARLVSRREDESGRT